MDRREALRKIAVGATAAVGASAIVSSPAFAYAGPIGTTAATLLAATGNPRRVDMTVTAFGTTTCSGSATGSTREYLGATAITVTLTGNAFLQLSPFGGTDGPQLPEFTAATSFRVRRVGLGTSVPDTNPFIDGDTFRIDIAVRHTCEYTGPGTGSQVVITSYNVVWSGGGPVVVLIP